MANVAEQAGVVSDAESTRQRIIEAAGSIFARKGFEGATVREICQLGKANLAAINYHFGDKRRLYIETVKQAHLSRAEEFPLPAWPEGTCPRQMLADFVLVFLRRVIGPTVAPWQGDLMMREVAQPTDACQELVRDSIGPHFQALNKILAELMPNATIAERHLTAFSVVGQCLHYRVVQPVIRLLVSAEEYATFEPELLARHITNLTLNGITAPKAERTKPQQSSETSR